jgi:hypothetical protein
LADDSFRSLIFRYCSQLRCEQQQMHKLLLCKSANAEKRILARPHKNGAKKDPGLGPG